MVRDFVLGEEFFSSLTALDAEIAREVAARGCPRCGGPLHRASYRRKPRGGFIGAAGEAFGIRHSLCCGAEGCRRRTLPPSLRFLGRRVYLEAVVVLATMVAQIMTTIREAWMLTGVPGWTLRRWRGWWQRDFVQSPMWVVMRTRFVTPAPKDDGLPQSLVLRLAEELGRQRRTVSVEDMCRWLAHLLAPDGSRFLRELQPTGHPHRSTQKMSLQHEDGVA